MGRRRTELHLVAASTAVLLIAPSGLFSRVVGAADVPGAELGDLIDGVSIETDKIEYGLREPIFVTIHNNSPTSLSLPPSSNRGTAIVQVERLKNHSWEPLGNCDFATSKDPAVIKFVAGSAMAGSLDPASSQSWQTGPEIGVSSGVSVTKPLRNAVPPSGTAAPYPTDSPELPEGGKYRKHRERPSPPFHCLNHSLMAGTYRLRFDYERTEASSFSVETVRSMPFIVHGN
jgi:hypothetical protein